MHPSRSIYFHPPASKNVTVCGPISTCILGLKNPLRHPQRLVVARTHRRKRPSSSPSWWKRRQTNALSPVFCDSRFEPIIFFDFFVAFKSRALSSTIISKRSSLLFLRAFSCRIDFSLRNAFQRAFDGPFRLLRRSVGRSVGSALFCSVLSTGIASVPSG
jgi:hypothetical protein